MQVPRSYIDRYGEAMTECVDALKAELRATLSLVDYSEPPEQLRSDLVSIMDALCEAASDVGATMSAEFYDGLRQMATGTGMGASLTYDSRRDPVATERAVRAFMERLLDGDTEGFESLMEERIELEAKRAAARNTIANVGRDRDQPRFARVPTGDRTCDFCLMLASRGPVYLTEESAGAFERFHAHCDCKVVPFWITRRTFSKRGGSRRTSMTMSVEGYDPDAYYREYQQRMEDDPKFAERMARASANAKARKRRR